MPDTVRALAIAALLFGDVAVYSHTLLTILTAS